MRKVTTLQLVIARVPANEVALFRELVGLEFEATEEACIKYSDRIDFGFLCSVLLSDKGRELARIVKSAISREHDESIERLLIRKRRSAQTIWNENKARKLLKIGQRVDEHAEILKLGMQINDEMMKIEALRRRKLATLFASLYNRDEEKEHEVH